MITINSGLVGGDTDNNNLNVFILFAQAWHGYWRAEIEGYLCLEQERADASTRAGAELINIIKIFYDWRQCIKTGKQKYL